MADISRVFSKEDLVLVRIRSVADPEYLRQSRSYQVSDCETMMTEVRKAFEARKVSPLLDQFEKPLHIIDQFVKGMTVLVQALDPIAQIIWGGFLIVFKNVVRFVDLIGTISACFDTLSNTLARSFLLHGLGGVGKTQLAAHFAYTHWDDYDIIIWAVADTEQSLDDHFLQAAAALGLPHEGDASAIVTNVMNWLTDCNHNWLIIFDNVDNESLLLRFWPKSAKGSILLTSRQRLLGTTMVDGACEVGSLEKEDGASMIQLLLENEVSDAQDRHLVEEMAKALGGLPLALAQMAGYLRTNHVTVREFLGNYNNSEYARRLFARPASLDHEQHQQTLETVWRLSLEKLSADAKTLLWITVFLHPDEMPCSIFQIRKVSPGRSLLPALQVLDTSHNTLQAGNRREEAVKSLETALDIRKVNMQIDYKCADPPLHIDIQLANAYSNLGIVAKQMGEFARAAQLYEQAIEIKERQRDHCAGFLLALSLYNVGKLHCLQGRVGEAVKFFRECQAEMSIYQDDDEMKARQAVWLCSLAEAEASLGRIEDAEAHFDQSLETLKKVMEGSLDAGMTCLRFGIFRYGAGRFEEALALFNDAERIFSVKPTVALDQQIVSKNRLAYCLHWLGRTYAQLGQESDSEEAQSRASELYVGITGKETSLDPEEALEGYGRLVSDD
ncbi:hypothetical protein CDV36_004891 [Fusarium kuroshium]|uniref:NB-ARC domain-containing protein n=1 Tax=Fusarium kuroshium TaxID=2010991 RepID=A0A3M2SD34_9HYPO|nr:hypothetical protein CDV36_004891 [Fusarium kuroshium]